MYEPLLFIHSWTRWVVLLSAIYFLLTSLDAIARGRAWTGVDARFVWAFDQILAYQALFGFALWLAASPVVHAAFLNPGLILSNPLHQFWALRHPLSMLVAVGAFQVGKVIARRSPATSRFKVYAITLTVTLAIILSAIPWPSLVYGRVLFRGF